MIWKVLINGEVMSASVVSSGGGMILYGRSDSLTAVGLLQHSAAFCSLYPDSSCGTIGAFLCGGVSVFS